MTYFIFSILYVSTFYYSIVLESEFDPKVILGQKLTDEIFWIPRIFYKSGALEVAIVQPLRTNIKYCTILCISSTVYIISNYVRARFSLVYLVKMYLITHETMIQGSHLVIWSENEKVYTWVILNRHGTQCAKRSKKSTIFPFH